MNHIYEKGQNFTEVSREQGPPPNKTAHGKMLWNPETLSAYVTKANSPLEKNPTIMLGIESNKYW